MMYKFIFVLFTSSIGLSIYQHMINNKIYHNPHNIYIYIQNNLYLHKQNNLYLNMYNYC